MSRATKRLCIGAGVAGCGLLLGALLLAVQNNPTAKHDHGLGSDLPSLLGIKDGADLIFYYTGYVHGNLEPCG